MYFCTQIVRAQRMSPNRIIIFLACLMTYASLYADSVESYVDSIKIYREDLPSHHGEKRINLFGKIYRFSQESEDVNLQRECLYDYLNEAQRQGNLEHEVNAALKESSSSTTTTLTIPFSITPPSTLSFCVSTASGTSFTKCGDYW